MTEARIIVTGSRSWRDYDRLVHELAYVAGWCSGTPVFVHGDASSGADLLTRIACGRLGWEQEPHPADWDTCSWPGCKPGHRRTRRDGTTYCPAAGNWRNQQMAGAGAVASVAFQMVCASPSCHRRGIHGSHGTADMTERLGAALIPVWFVSEGVRGNWIGLNETAGVTP
jgi:YspA, cpYpsA-related SLOG family